MNWKIGIVVLVVVVLAGWYLTASNDDAVREEQVVTEVPDHKSAKYVIEGETVTLGGDTQYFGNELVTDLNNDGRGDVVFVVTQSPGGSGTFFYAVAALNTPNGYVGSDGYLLGDRVAPQSTTLSPNPNHRNVVVFNYADRAPEEPMTAQPSVGKSAYLKLDPNTMEWGVVVPDFEGESR